MQHTDNSLHISFSEQYSISDIERLFDSCSSNATNPFLSKAWLCSWIATLDSLPTLVIFKNNDEAKGFVFLGKQQKWYGDIYFINQTGNQNKDQVWIEHNDIIASDKWLNKCRQTLLEALCSRSRFHRLVVSLSAYENWSIANSFYWSREKDDVARVVSNQFTSVSVNKEYSTTLSKNARSAISRSNTYISKHYGEVSFTQINDPKALVQLLEENVAPLHLSQWGETKEGSGFSNPLFVAFHEQLCQYNSNEYKLEILSFKAGQMELGYLYMFLCGNTAFFYLSAINYNDSDNRYKPGLLMHKLAIEHYVARGYENYDFLAGFARYKESLSNHHYALHTLHISKISFFNRLLYSSNRFIKNLKSS